MKILFFMRSTIYVRNFEAALRLVAGRGHDVHVVADPHLPESNDLIARLCRDHPRIRHSPAPPVPFTAWSFLGLELRRAIDYLRYLAPDFADAPKLRTRAERNAPGFILTALRRPLLGTSSGRWLLQRALGCADRALPRNAAIDEFIRSHGPDLVLVTPLVEPGSPQAEYLRSARALGIRTGLCVYSWDNLTNKGLIHDPLDLVTVWNEPMKKEAIALHHVPADRVVVTGAVPYDHWFTWQPRASRQAFCARVGLPPGQPYLLYLCSSRFIAPNEVGFIRRWLAELRSASAALREASVLIRPHPQNTDAWNTADLTDMERVVVWPRTGANPVDEGSRADYYDSIHYSAAVIGVNTSAQIESAIVGRGVYTLLAPEFRDTQQGTLHFNHLLAVNGGLLHVAHDFAEHVAQLEHALRGRADDGRCRRFVEAFVRPHGIDVAAAPLLVDALEAVASGEPPRPDRGPWYGRFLRLALAPAARRLARSAISQQERGARQERKERRHAAVVERRDERAVAKRRARVEAARRKQQDKARREAEQSGRQMAATNAYANFLRVRDWARRLPRDCGLPLTDAEQQLQTSLAHLWTAAPETIASLRRWCDPISGVRADDYEPGSPEAALKIRSELGVFWRQLGRELFVPESPMLGGFGYTKNGELYNEDTLRFFTAIVALHDAAVLGEHRTAGPRRLVWEVGGGWGGFAYQFKTLCPNVTYVITASPDLFLVSAVYLMTVFPAARCRFYDASSPDDLWTDWTETDFVFVPESAVASLRPPQLDLVLDLLTLRQMEAARARSHVQRAFDLGGRFVYSVLPGDPTPSELMIWKTIERLYWPHPVPPRRDAKWQQWPPAVEPRPPADALAHLVGWRRVLP